MKPADRARLRAEAAAAFFDEPTPKEKTDERPPKKEGKKAAAVTKEHTGEIVLASPPVPPMEPPAVPGKSNTPKGKLVPRAEPEPIAPHHFPKKFTPQDFGVGEVVFYQESRYWVEYVPHSWAEGCYVRISDAIIRPGPEFPPPKDRTSFCVHADTLSKPSKQPKHNYGKMPTPKSDAARVRAKSGVKDVGDEVAVLLRDCPTLTDAYECAALYLKLPQEELERKYSHLNHGQQRMILGNRMRAHHKKLHDARTGKHYGKDEHAPS